MNIWHILKKKTKPSQLCFADLERWLDNALDTVIPEDVVAFCFNLYEDADSHWTMELIGASSFDKSNNDWACDEVFTTRKKPLTWQQEADWPQVLDLSQRLIKQYLEQGKYRHRLTGCKGLAVGFVEGDLVLL